MITISYPAGYTDPDWDGSEADFADKVIPARMEALTVALNASLPDWARKAGMGFEWGCISSCSCEPDVAHQVLVDDRNRCRRCGLYPAGRLCCGRCGSFGLDFTRGIMTCTSCGCDSDFKPAVPRHLLGR
jgi:hypothetical protein